LKIGLDVSQQPSDDCRGRKTLAAKEKHHMSTFTIHSDNNIAALAGLPAGADRSQALNNQKELAKIAAEWPASRLVETWNSFA
jgi:hypothetical protein